MVFGRGLYAAKYLLIGTAPAQLQPAQTVHVENLDVPRVNPAHQFLALQPCEGTRDGYWRGAQIICEVTAWLVAMGEMSSEYVFPSRVNRSGHLSTRQYARLLREWMTLIGLDPCAYGTHSLRRTKASLIYKRTGNLRVVQLLLGHTKLESTVRYLGIEVDDALTISEQTEV